MNRQGPDVGDQYRSAIFFHNPEQEAAARAAMSRLEHERRYRRPIVTEIVPAPAWWRAEEYHQKLLREARPCGVPRLRLTRRRVWLQLAPRGLVRSGQYIR